MDILDSDVPMTYDDIGKLAFDLLPILLSRIQALEGNTHEVTAFLQSYPPFYLIRDDPLELEKIKVTRAMEKFLKV
jgi:hypothetical protein